MEALRTHSITPASPTAGIRNQMSRATITMGPNQNNSHPVNTPTDPFGTSSRGKSNLFTNTNPRAPATETQKAALRICIAAFPMQPDMPTGLENYRNQCHTWLATFGANQRITELTGFPLHPGGAPPSSGECYVCGKVGHSQPNCTNEQVPFKERHWRSICTTILGHGRSAPASVNFVKTAEDFGWMNSAGFKDNTGQENGEGPST